MMAAPARRGFLRGLVSLPLIGGGVTLIGQPSAVAEPVTYGLLQAYNTWLHFEQRYLGWDIAGMPESVAYYGGTHNERYNTTVGGMSMVGIGDAGRFHSPRCATAASRAALVLSAVGCDWREGVNV